MDTFIKQLLLDKAIEDHGDRIDPIDGPDNPGGYRETERNYEFWYNVGTSTHLQYQRKVVIGG
jgi:hypothetical protein